MEYIRIKNSDLKVSRLCMGGCPLGGYGWGRVQDEDLLLGINEAIESGVTMFDTADTYGLGHSEEILAKGLGEHRKAVTIATKFGVRIENGNTFYDNSPDYIKVAVDRSLKRLNTDYIDLYQVHYRDQVTPLSTVIETLEELKSVGKIRYYGLSNIHRDDVKELESHIGSFISFQDEYSLACRKNETDMLELPQKSKMTPLTWGSLGQGILTGKYDKNCSFSKDDRRSRDIYVNFHGEKLLKNLKIVDVMKDIAKEIEKPVSAIAIRFILDFLPESIVLAGIKNPNQLRCNCEAFGWRLSEEQIKRLDEVSR